MGCKVLSSLLLCTVGTCTRLRLALVLDKRGMSLIMYVSHNANSDKADESQKLTSSAELKLAS